MSFLDTPYLSQGYFLRQESYASWSVFGQNGLAWDNFQHLGHIFYENDHYVAQVQDIERFPTLEHAALWIQNTPTPDLAPLGLQGFNRRVLKVLWRFDRGYVFGDRYDIPPSTEKAFLPSLLHGPLAAPPLALVGEVMEHHIVLDTPQLGLAIAHIYRVSGFARVKRVKAGWSVAYEYGDLLKKRRTRKHLKDLLTDVGYDTFAIIPQSSRHARLQDQQQVMASLDGIEDHVETYFQDFTTYQAALQRPR